jgi:MtN3 and saliva related transmembrane protein
MMITALHTSIGFAAGTLTTIAFLPQVLHVWQTKRADDLHWGMLLTFTVGVVLWLIYGISLRLMPVILPNAVTLALQAAIIFLKLRYARAAPRQQEQAQLSGSNQSKP